MRKLKLISVCIALVTIITSSCNATEHASEMFSKRKETSRAKISRCPTPPRPSSNTGKARRDDNGVIADARAVAIKLILKEGGWRELPGIDENTKCFSCNKFLWEIYPYCTCISESLSDNKSRVYCGCSNYEYSCSVNALRKQNNSRGVVLPMFLFVDLKSLKLKAKNKE